MTTVSSWRNGDSVVAASGPYSSAWLIELRGDIDCHTVEPARLALREALRAGSGPLLFDAAAVTFGDAQLLNLLLAAARQRPTAVVAPTARVARLMDAGGLRQVVVPFATREAALAHVVRQGESRDPADGVRGAGERRPHAAGLTVAACAAPGAPARAGAPGGRRGASGAVRRGTPAQPGGEGARVRRPV